MKSTIKLIFLVIIVGFTYKYMSDNQITVSYVLNLINEKISSFILKIESTNSSLGHSEQIAEKDLNSKEFSNSSNSINIYNTSYPENSIGKTEPKPLSFPVENINFNNPKFEAIDKRAVTVPDNYCTDIPTLVNYLIEPTSNDLEKARAIFTWIAHNISYDDNGYNTGNYADCSALGVFKNRVSVCSGFAELFKVMGQEAGLEIVKIKGYAKGYGYSPGQSFTTTNHAWNAVKINDQWILCDVTWGNGSGTTVNGRLKSIKEFDDFWFNTNPYNLIFTHLPQDSQWQLIPNVITKKQFEQLPYVRSSFFKMGFQGETIFNEILSGKYIELPHIYDECKYVQAISLPLQGVLTQTQPIYLELKSNIADDIAVINNGKWTFFEKQDDTFSLTFQPKRGELEVSARFKDQGSGYWTLLAYRVK